MARKNAGRTTIIVAVALALLAGGTVVAYQAATPSDAKPASRTADLVLAERMSFDITTTATGELEARRQVELRSQLDDRSSIVEIVAEGTFVQAGTLLVRLKSDQIRTDIEEETLRTESARADLVAAENQYEIQVSQNESRLEQAQVRLRLAELSLQQWLEGDDKQRMQDLQLDLERAQIDLARIEDLYERKVRLQGLGFLSSDELKQEEIRLIAARAGLARSELALESYQQYERERELTQLRSDVEQATAEVDRVERQNEIELVSRNAQRINARRQLQVREARLAEDERQLINCDIVAPTSGLVVYATSVDRGSRWGQNGQTPLQIGRDVSPNESLIILPDTTEMIAKVRVHESLAGRVRPGQSVNIAIDALAGHTFTGEVVSIGVLAEGSDWRDPNRREYTVRTTIRTPDGVELKPSMRADATIALGRVDNALAVPIQAIFAEGLVRYVHVPRGNKFVRVPVQVGRRSELYAEVVAGIDAGTPVLVREPAAGEVIAEAWRAEQLRAVGLELNDAGEPQPIGGAAMPEAAPGGMPGGRPAGMGAGGQGAPQGGGQGGGQGGDQGARRGGGRPQGGQPPRDE